MPVLPASWRLEVGACSLDDSPRPPKYCFLYVCCFEPLAWWAKEPDFCGAVAVHGRWYSGAKTKGLHAQHRTTVLVLSSLAGNGKRTSWSVPRRSQNQRDGDMRHGCRRGKGMGMRAKAQLYRLPGLSCLAHPHRRQQEKKRITSASSDADPYLANPQPNVWTTDQSPLLLSFSSVIVVFFFIRFSLQIILTFSKNYNIFNQDYRKRYKK